MRRSKRNRLTGPWRKMHAAIWLRSISIIRLGVSPLFLSRLSTTACQDGANPPPLLLRREVNKWPELAFGHNGRGHGIAECGNGIQDFWCRVKEPPYLGYTGTGNPQLAGQISRSWSWTAPASSFEGFPS